MFRLTRMVLRFVLVLTVILAVFILIARMIWPLPENRADRSTRHIPASDDTRLGARFLPDEAAHPGLTGTYPLMEGPDAFVARIAMIRAADAALDLRYYIWHDDLTGMLLLEELRQAAARGVKIRLLLDDNGIPGLDDIFSALDALPNVEVRLFNPFVLRKPRMLNYVFDFFRLNRRMHNKSISADGIATLIGGRNIGDIYFAFGEAHYRDLDVLAVGQGARDVAEDFDRYWNSDSAYDAAQILAPAPDGLTQLADRLAAYAGSDEAARYFELVKSSAVAVGLATGNIVLDWTPAHLVSDDPAKGLGKARDDQLLVSQLGTLLGEPKSSIALISAYFVPGDAGTDLLVKAAAKGLRVTTLTNSQEATDVPLVQSGYIRHRRELVKNGVAVWELARIGEAPEDVDFGLMGSSTASLHTKSFAIDGARAFIGSFNFDPRSARLNCEMGFLIESPHLARLIEDSVSDEVLRRTAYRVTLDGNDRLMWSGPQDTSYDHDPGTSLLGRALVKIASYLPIAWML